MKILAEVTRHIAQNDVEPLAEQVLECVREVVEQQGAQSALGSLQVFPAHEAIDIACIGVNEFTQDVDAQVTRGSRQQHVAQRLTFTVAEVVERVPLQQGIEG